MKKYKHLLALIIIFLSCYYISVNWFQFQLIQGSSMKPSYKEWQLVILNKMPKSLGYGDVITFYSPSLDAILVKRIVACPGDTVQITDNILYVNGTPSNTTLNSPIHYAGIVETPLTLATNEYFVLGDNYDESIDSRYPEVGCILDENILGTVFPHISPTK